jgi:hypothetical protein
MKKMLPILLLTFTATKLFSQKVTINWGEESKKELMFRSFVNGSGSDMIKLCFDVKRKGFLGRNTTLTPVLTRFTDKLNEQAERVIEADEDGVVFNDLLSIKGKLFLFTSQYDKDAKSTSYYCQPLNIQTLNPEGKLINMGTFDAVKKSNQSSVGYDFSKDSSKILMFGNNAFKKNENEKYYIKVLDQNMQKLWDKTIELPYKDKFVSIEDQLVTNEGRVGVLIKHYDQEVTKEAIRKDGDKIPAYKTKMLVYDKENANPVEYILDIGNKFVHTLQLADDNINNLLLFGMYKEKNNGYITGFFTAIFDKKTNEVTTKNLNQFPQSLVEQIKIDKQGSDKESDPGLSKVFRLNDVVERENGSRDFILEYSSEVYVPPSSYYNGTTWVTTGGYWMYNYGDIIDINLKPDGKTVIARIPKMQTSRDVRYFSNFKALPYKNKLLVFYNDDDDNIDRDIEKKPDPLHKFNKSVFVMGVIGEGGDVTREILFRNKDNKLTTATRECMRIGKNRIGLYAQKLGGIFSSAKDMVGIMEIK